MFENQEIVAYNALVNPALKEKVRVVTYMYDLYIMFKSTLSFRNLLCFISAKH